MSYDINQLVDDNGGTFHFTTMLIRRVRELAGGAQRLIESDLTDPIEIAIEECAEGKISFEEIEHGEN